MGTSKKYHYHVNILFSKDRETFKGVERQESGYTGSKGNKDAFIFEPRKLSIQSYRRRQYEDGTILSNAKNALNEQIIKGLLCYYALADDFPQIESISIVCKMSGASDYYYNECQEFENPIRTNVAEHRKFDSSVLPILLDVTAKAKAIRISMSYWLKAAATTDEYAKFDKLWRAFNCLYRYQSNSNKDIEGQRNMREFLLEHERDFNQTKDIVTAYTEDELRNGFRWQRMILNDYDNRRRTEALRDFVMRYSDGRIMRLLQEKLQCRRDFIAEENFTNDIDNHILQNQATVSDMELVTFLAIKYAYFVRNKMVHGEVSDGTFKIGKDNLDNEMAKLNKILEVLVFELISNHQLLRDA